MENITDLFCLGYGYSAKVFVKLFTEKLTSQGCSLPHIVGTHRKCHEKTQCPSAEIVPFSSNATKTLARTASHILVSASPNENGDPVINELKNDILENTNLKWLGYLSTTSVYGNHNGDWVNEETECHPTTKRGMFRLKAEQEWMQLYKDFSVPVHIFRLAGIYGPGRGPFEKVTAKNARQVIKPNQIFSRIHVEDIALVLMKSIEKPNPGSIYNVCDNEPAPPQDVLTYAANLLGIPPPKTVDFNTSKQQLSEMAASFYSDNKRVSNEKIHQELVIKLKYPDFRAGLKSLLVDEKLGRNPETSLT